MDEIYKKAAGHWKDLCRALDKIGAAVGSLLRVKRDRATTHTIFERATNRHVVPEIITFGKGRANEVSIHAYSDLTIAMRQEYRRAEPSRRKTCQTVHG
jgi:transposase-like protein